MIKSYSIGEGAYGIVYLATSDNGQSHAVKRNFVESDITGIGTIREMDILNKCRIHPNIVSLSSVYVGCPFRNTISPVLTKDRAVNRINQRDDDVHYVFPVASFNLLKFINNKAESNYYEKAYRYMYDILCGLDFLHRNKIIHRDLKPDNILLYNDGSAKICDMGLAIPYIKQDKKSCNVITSWYRPPELTINYEFYDYKVDIWSLGCIFFEIISRTIFCQTAKEDSQEILRTILENLPQTPTSDDYRKLTSKDLSNKIFSPCNLKKLTHRSLNIRFSLMKNGLERANINYDSLCQLIESTLQLNWEKRPSTQELLKSSLFTPFYKENREIDKINWQYQVIFSNRIERTYLLDIFKRFINSITFTFVNWRMIFQAFSLIDRYLIIEKNIHNSFDLEIRFYICLYISYKYFNENQPMSFSMFYNYKDLNYVKQFEGYLIYQILNINVYQPTLYEAFDDFDHVLDEKDNVNLLFYYLGDDRINGHSYKLIAEAYLKNQMEHLLSKHPSQLKNGQ